MLRLLLLYNLNRLPTYDFLGACSCLWPSLSMGVRGISLPTSMKGFAPDVGTPRLQAGVYLPVGPAPLMQWSWRYMLSKRYFYRTWWIIRSTSANSLRAGFFFIRQSEQGTSSWSEAPSDFFC
jgi:hypothetical protein